MNEEIIKYLKNNCVNFIFSILIIILLAIIVEKMEPINPMCYKKCLKQINIA